VRPSARGVAWAFLLLGLLGVAGYVGLLVSRKVSPPIVPIDSHNHLPGYSTGDAVLLSDARTGNGVHTTDLVAVHYQGHVVVGRIDASLNNHSQYRLLDAVPGDDPIVVADHDLIGRADRRIPIVGWALLGARNPGIEIIAGLLVVGFLVLLVFTGRSPLELLDRDGEPTAVGGAPLALPAGPSTRPPSVMPYVGIRMAITPEDLRQVRFAQVRKGYDTEAVDRALETLANSVEAMLHERQQLIDRLQVAETEVSRYRGMEGQLVGALAAAERTGLAPGTTTAPDGTTVDLAEEMRAIRSLLNTVLTQGGRPGQPPAPPPPPA